jgi:hypothetical protein
VLPAAADTHQIGLLPLTPNSALVIGVAGLYSIAVIDALLPRACQITGEAGAKVDRRSGPRTCSPRNPGPARRMG